MTRLTRRPGHISAAPARPSGAARDAATRLARAALDGPLAAHHLDAIITLTANPACLTDYVLGDHDVFHTSAPSAVAGYPAVSVPCGYVAGLPVGRAQAVHAFAHSSNRGKKYEDFFCLTPRGVRVGIASPKLVKTLPKSERSTKRWSPSP